MYKKKIFISTPFTLEMLRNAQRAAVEHHGMPTTIFTSQKNIDALIEWQKQEKWLKSLPALEEKKERLRIRLKNRKPHLPVNLPG